MIAVLSLGANLGDPAAQIQKALDSFGPGLVAASRIYRTSPVGGPQQDDFLNCVALVEIEHAHESLTIAQWLEDNAGRERNERWGPRTLDVDVITIHNGMGDVVSHNPSLTLPHPSAHSRLFVLVPWAEVEPDAVLAGHGKVTELIEAVRAADPSQVIEAVA